MTEPKIELPKSAPNYEYIRIGDLPKNIQAKNLCIYDRDGNYRIDKQNSQGVNELELFEPYAKKMGLDLSKYKTQCWILSEENGVMHSVTKSPNYYTKNGYFIEDRKSTADLSTLDTRVTDYYDTECNRIAQDKYGFKNSRAIPSTCEIYSRNNLTNGKYCLQEVTTISYHMEYRNLIDKVTNLVQFMKDHNPLLNNSYEKYLKTNIEKIKKELGNCNTKTEYQLNNETVQAKSIGKGRYQVMTKKGETFYISHDGKILKNSYVELNP